MKTLLIRPGIHIMETFKDSWPPDLNYLQKVYTDYSSLFRGLFEFQSFSQSSTLSVGSTLKKMGEDVDYLDVPFEFGVPLTEKSAATIYAKIRNYIHKGDYDVVGISCTGLLEGIPTKKIAEITKNVYPDTVVMVGGYQAASEAHDFMEKIPAIDILVQSDFELIAHQLYRTFEGSFNINNTPNILYRHKDTVHTTRKTCTRLKPDHLPYYDYSLVDPYIPGYSLFAMEASRGCMYNCSFCQEKILRTWYITKDPEKAADEMVTTAHYIADRTTPVVFYFCDPLWGAHPAWVKKFCTHLIKKRHTPHFQWVCEARVGQFSHEELTLMKQSGCITIGYGVESLSPKMLTIMNKTKTPGQYIDSVKTTVEKTLAKNIHTVLLFILGMPGETHTTLQETLTAIKNLPLTHEKLHIKFGLPDILPGTALDFAVHNPHHAEQLGVVIHEENTWHNAYIPRFTLLFDPSHTLSAADMTDTFLNLMHGTDSVTASFGKQLEKFPLIQKIIDKGIISPADLANLGNIYRKAVTGI
ncbi:MAG: radical SAM protein [Candidatus Methanofastidiosia archaeon]